MFTLTWYKWICGGKNCVCLSFTTFVYLKVMGQEATQSLDLAMDMELVIFIVIVNLQSLVLVSSI